MKADTNTYLSAHTKIYNLQKAHSLCKISFQIQLLDLRQNLISKLSFLEDFSKHFIKNFLSLDIFSI